MPVPHPQLAVIIPCYNEEDVLIETIRRLSAFLKQMIHESKVALNSYLLFVDDGSIDQTWNIIYNMSTSKPFIQGLKLSRNFGHQNALLAGLFQVNDADIAVSIDADLQNDIHAIKDMILEYQDGNEIVLAVRNDRNTDSFFKKRSALAFYKVLKLIGVESVRNHADFRLMSKQAINTLKDFREVNLYLRGLIPLLGFKQSIVYYDAAKRFAGTSKYNFKKMLSFAWNGISSLSVRPLHFVTFCGFAVFLISIILSVYVLAVYFMNQAIAGWASTVIPIYFLGGIQLLCIGLLGEYIAKIYNEVKQRPRFIIEQFIKSESPLN